MLQIGKQVDNFTLMDENSEPVSLEDFKGRKVIVYFYPKDNTPGCTTEACSFRDEYLQIQEKNAVVIGISGDSSKSHRNFKTKHDLPFILLSDPEKKVIRYFGAWGEKKNYGKTYEGIIRSTFILDEEHKVQFVFQKVKTKNHALAVLEEMN